MESFPEVCDPSLLLIVFPNPEWAGFRTEGWNAGEGYYTLEPLSLAQHVATLHRVPDRPKILAG